VKFARPGEVPVDFFAEEARSLAAIASAATVRVPRVIAVGEQWLLLEWLEPGRASRAMWRTLGAAIAALHDCKADAFGWPADNYIGSLPQHNRTHERWPDFWREERLLPQWRRARKAGYFDAGADRVFDHLLARLDDLLAAGDTDGPSLLHGDLWNGNVHAMANGEAAVIDPSSAYGHREVDLAMAELFGGFDRAFFAAYEEVRPLLPGYAESRRRIYQIYYLLVHVNLFGAGYVGPVMTAIAGGDGDGDGDGGTDNG
jgi:fructosamine-3-kinase